MQGLGDPSRATQFGSSTPEEKSSQLRVHVICSIQGRKDKELKVRPEVSVVFPHAEDLGRKEDFFF